MFADEGIIDLKHKVLKEVAVLAFEGTLDEKRDNIPYQIIPGPNAQYRCCIYKEREVLRHRIRLTEGKHLGLSDDGNILQVIEPACVDCPISTYVVTNNCQNCVGKACVNSCKFDACTPGRYHSHIDPQLCKECGKCAKACPYNAIAHLVRPCKNACPVNAISYDENGISVIDPDKCIRCGQCIHRCPYGAIGTITDIVPVIEAIKSDKNVYLMLAPATEGMFGEGVTMDAWRKTAKAIGFTDAYDVGFGGDLTAAFEAKEWQESYEKGEKKTTSCCPAFVNMINKRYPDLKDMISDTVSPMCAVSRMIKAKDPDGVTVFVGPCIAKKSEAKDFGIEGNADYVLVYSELQAIMLAKGIPVEFESDNQPQEASVYGKRFANSGGVTNAVLKCLEENGFDETLSVIKANGARDCDVMLKLMELGRFDGDFLEGMACEGGCVGGPCARLEANLAKKARDAMINRYDDRGVTESISSVDTDSFSMHK